MTRASSSILFRTARPYLVITVLNITAFVLLVFEHQIDLISQNAVLSSLNPGTAVKYSLDAIAAINGAILGRLEMLMRRLDQGESRVENYELEARIQALTAPHRPHSIGRHRGKVGSRRLKASLA